MTNILLESALKYADSGWYVFPLHGIENGRCTCGVKCPSPGKHPRVSRGFLDASTDASVIQRWWTRWPSANIGIATGSVSGIYVLDMDNKMSVEIGPGSLIGEGDHSLRLKENEIGRLPDTLSSHTGSGGTHLVFLYPELESNLPNRAGLLPSLDTRGDGGYIVAPPSLHQSGNRYRWIEPGTELAKLPEAWINFLLENLSADSKPTLTLSDDEKILKGQGRHEWLFRYGSKLRGQHGLEYVPLYGALAAINNHKLLPPLEPREVEHIVSSCMKFAAGMPPTPLDTDIPSIPALLEGDDLATPFADFMAEEPEPFKNLVARLLHSGEAMILGGPPNIGKTWAVMDMMLGISSGTLFAGHFHCEPTRVLFIDEEGSRRGDWERFRMLLSGRDESAVQFPLYTKIDSGIKLDNPRGLAAISRLIERYRPGAVFLDSLVRMHAGNESDNRAMAELFATVKRLMVSYGVSFVFTHHIRKPSKEVKDDPMWMLRGAGDIQGFPDSVAIFLPGEDTSEIEVVHTKMRNGEKHKPFNLKLQIDDADQVAKIGYLELDQNAKQNKNRYDILKLLREYNGQMTTQQIAAWTGLSEATVTSHMKVLGATDAVRSVREAGSWFHQLNMEG
jgi:DNA-binding transcriptional ArsR family regulator